MNFSLAEMGTNRANLSITGQNVFASGLISPNKLTNVALVASEKLDLSGGDELDAVNLTLSGNEVDLSRRTLVTENGLSVTSKSLSAHDSYLMSLGTITLTATHGALDLARANLQSVGQMALESVGEVNLTGASLNAHGHRASVEAEHISATSMNFSDRAGDIAFNATGNVDLSDGSLINAHQVKISGQNVDLSAAEVTSGDLTSIVGQSILATDATLTATGDMTLDATEGLDLSGQTTVSSANVTLEGASVNASEATVTSAGTVTARATAGSVDMASSTINAHGIDIDATGDAILTNANVKSNGANVSVNGANVLAAGLTATDAMGDVELTATGKVDLTEGAITSSTNINVTANTVQANKAQLNATNAINLDAEEGLDLSGQTTVSGSNVTLEGASVNTSEATVTSAGTLRANATAGSVDMASSHINAHGIDIDATSDAILTNANVTSNGANVAVNGANVLAAGLTATDAMGEVELKATGKVDLTGNGKIELNKITIEGTEVDVSSRTLNATTNVALTGGAITATGAKVTAGGLTSMVGQSISATGATLTATGDMTLDAEDALDLSAQTTVSGSNVTLEGASVNASEATVTSAGALKANATAGSVDMGSSHINAHGIDIDATDNLTLADTHWDIQGDINLNAQDSIDLNRAKFEGSLGNLNWIAGDKLADNLDLTDTNFSALTAKSIRWNAGGTILLPTTLTSLTATEGGVYLHTQTLALPEDFEVKAATSAQIEALKALTLGDRFKVTASKVVILGGKETFEMGEDIELIATGEQGSVALGSQGNMQLGQNTTIKAENSISIFAKDALIVDRATMLNAQGALVYIGAANELRIAEDLTAIADKGVILHTSMGDIDIANESKIIVGTLESIAAEQYGGVKVDSARNVSIGGNATIFGNHIEIKAKENIVFNSEASLLGNKVNVAAQKDLSFAADVKMVGKAGGVAVRATEGDLFLGGNLTILGNTDKTSLQAGQDIVVNGVAQVLAPNNDIELLAGRHILLKDKLALVGNRVQLIANTGNIEIHGNATLATDLPSSDSTSVQEEGIRLIASEGNIAFFDGATIYSDSDVGLLSKGNVFIRGQSRIASTGTLNIVAQEGSIVLEKGVSLGNRAASLPMSEKIYLKAGQDITQHSEGEATGLKAKVVVLEASRDVVLGVLQTAQARTGNDIETLKIEAGRNVALGLSGSDTDITLNAQKGGVLGGNLKVHGQGNNVVFTNESLYIQGQVAIHAHGIEGQDLKADGLVELTTSLYDDDGEPGGITWTSVNAGQFVALTGWADIKVGQVQTNNGYVDLYRTGLSAQGSIDVDSVKSASSITVYNGNGKVAIDLAHAVDTLYVLTGIQGEIVGFTDISASDGRYHWVQNQSQLGQNLDLMKYLNSEVQDIPFGIVPHLDFSTGIAFEAQKGINNSLVTSSEVKDKEETIFVERLKDEANEALDGLPNRTKPVINNYWLAENEDKI